MEYRHLSIISGGKKWVLNSSSILYVIMVDRNAEIHVSGGTVYETRMTLSELSDRLGEDFIQIHRGCIVSVMAIHDITDTINLSNGETLIYTIRKKKQIMEQFLSRQESIIRSFETNNTPATQEAYRRHYRCFEKLPIAFTDIEMVFSEEKRAMDWIFRYANAELARLEKQPLHALIDHSFCSLFPTINSLWLRTYERSVLYGEILEINDYSPEIDAHLKIICFPTFKGHCGCILFNLSETHLSAEAINMLQSGMVILGKRQGVD